MTHCTLPDAGVPTSVLEFLMENADAIDRGDLSARTVLPELAAAGLLDLGAPGNADGHLPRMVAVLEILARRSLSASFALWSHRVTFEFLAAAGTEYARTVLARMQAGTSPGVSAMASGFRELVGLGRADLTAERVDGGHLLRGRLPWASNLYPDAVVVTAARDDDGRPLVVAFPLDSDGVEVGPEQQLLALRGTASSSIALEDVYLPDAQVLSRDFAPFMASVRPAFSVLQTAFCVGLGAECLQQARQGLSGINEAYAEEVEAAGRQLASLRRALGTAAGSIGTAGQRPPREFLEMRLDAGRLASTLAALEIRTAGGRGFAVTSGANRRFRESTFIPLQSPSEAQLRRELAAAGS